jgi:hypothetical protein
VQDAERGGRLGYLDRVVDVAYDGPAGGLGEVGGAFEAEGGWEVCCYGLDLVAGGSVFCCQDSNSYVLQVSMILTRS